MKEGYKKTELGWIPEEWEVNTTGKIFEFIGGLSISREKLGAEGVNYLHYGDIHKRNENFIDLEVDEQWIPKFNEEYKNIKNGVKLETGDVVFADASEDYEGIGKSVSIINYDNKPFVAGLHTIVGKDRNNLLDEHYKRYCFSTKNIRKQFRVLATGTSVYGISRENIKKIKFLIPPLKEQQKIAEILSTIDTQIDDTDKLIEKTKELKKGLMQRFLTKGIGHTEFKITEVGEIPVEWEVRCIGEISDLINGRAFKPSDWKKEGIPIIRIQNLNGTDEYNYYEGEVEDRYFIRKGQLLFSWSGSRGTSFGPHIWHGIDGVLNQHIFKVNIKEDIPIDINFIYYNLKGVTEKIEQEAHGSAGLVHITKGNLEKVKLSIPMLEEQIRIGNILSSVDTQIEEYENKKSKLEELKKGLMQQLLTGKIRVV